MRCDICKTIPQDFSIKSPRDLTQGIRLVKDLLRKGGLKQSSYWPSSYVKHGGGDFMTMMEKGGWEDYMEYYFECCDCDELYQIVAETYHGSGGRFGKITPDRTWPPTSSRS